mmetsp:Transcript_237/g.240  ORF Transcript_237/g.240 Transcript_237/m.240 type:complete len:144 (+) Transcript_237:286-717(+)
MGEGPCALVSNGGPDRSVVHIISKSITAYLTQHYERLRTNWYYTGKGVVEAYPRVASSEGAFGSCTSTKGLKIEACAKYIQILSTFNEDQFFSNTRYFFSYQIKIYVDPDYEGEFHPCQLYLRHWEIHDGDRKEVVHGEGVIG